MANYDTSKHNITCLLIHTFINRQQHLQTLLVSGDEFTYIPPTSEGWGNILFSVSLSVHTSTQGGVPCAGYGWGGTPSRYLGGGYPSQIQVLGGKVPHTRSGLDGVHTPTHLIRKVSSCYAVGSVPLALTQEDCLVVSLVLCHITCVYVHPT